MPVVVVALGTPIDMIALIEGTQASSEAMVHISLDKEKIAVFCRKHHIRRLALFGSVLRDDFGPDSDVDVLVEFEPTTRVGMIRLAGMEIELGELLGRRVDLNTPGFLSEYYRQRVLAEAEIQYDAA